MTWSESYALAQTLLLTASRDSAAYRARTSGALLVA
jgi:hypothetical protein